MLPRLTQTFQISTFLLVRTPKLFFTTSRPHGGKRCHGNKANTQRQPQTGRPSEVACTHTQAHTKLQFTTTTAVTQRHSVPPMKGRLCGLFLEGLKGCCSGAMEEVVAHRQALLAASHTLLYPPQAPSLHLTCNMKCFYLPPEPYEASRKSVLAFAHSVLSAPVSTTELQLRYSNHSNWQRHNMFVPDDASTCIFLYFYKNVGTEDVRSYLTVIENILNKNTTKTDAYETWHQVF